VVDALYLKTAIIREDDVSNKKSIFHLYLPYNMGLVAPYLRRFAFKDGHIKYKKRKSSRIHGRPR